MTENKKKTLWPWMITIIYTVFALGMVAVLYFSMFQNVELVTPDYYSQELKYEGQIDRIRNTNQLKAKPEIQFSRESGVLSLRMPDDFLNHSLKGEIVLFRPSNSRLDEKFTLECDSNNRQEIPLNKIRPGKWRVKVTWDDGSKEYYYEDIIII